MAQSGNSGVAVFAGLIVVMLIAVGALAVFKLNIGGINDMLFNTDEVNRPTQADDPYPHKDPDGQDNSERAFTAKPPDRPEYVVKRAQPLPERLTVKREIDGYQVEIELCLVPQGWFIMGADDGVIANGPKRWVWLDDFYIGKTEFTNAQYYGFILGGGYTDSQWWTIEGANFMNNSERNRGTEYLGWRAIDDGRRMWRLASPEDDIVLEVQRQDRELGRPDTTVLVLPDGAGFSEYLAYDRTARTVQLKYLDKWRDVSGADIRKTTNSEEQFRLKTDGYLHITDVRGHVKFDGLPTADRYTVIAWPDGDNEPPIFGGIRRAEAHYLRGPDIPVVGVTWFEADACARYFGAQIPTEAQWEKAARGADGRTFPWGDELEMNLEMPTQMGKRQTTRYANFNRWRLEPVGRTPDGVSPYGLLDVVGNAMEWCRDVFVTRPKWDERNPEIVGKATDRRSIRGAHTDDDDPQLAKVYHRRDSDPYDRRPQFNRGFRVVFDPDTALKLAR